MSQNDLTLDYDGNNVCITIKSRVSFPHRIFLICCNLVFLAMGVLAIIFRMPAVALAAILLLAFYLRYSLWKLYGRERLTINKRLVTYSNSCLFFKTHLQTRQVGKKITVIPYELHGQRKPKMVNVIFETCNINNVPENVYEFSLPVQVDQAEMISYMLSLLYLNKVSFDFNKTKICLN
ncbi:hypothetical protein [Pedobacter cryoconitis]|uniref:Uncharacterized protein n=1 Tax=Pedobacter cryoconitis TaxID=188932 RepID=A0A327TC44_9SPHI|nr:hypothetical protein [Pedobacter cryoconitis]RAJ37203.1 hypothetical protein LY11_00279 [Pedobacter cryoconitis]